jgi:hypothetical protein
MLVIAELRVRTRERKRCPDTNRILGVGAKARDQHGREANDNTAERLASHGNALLRAIIRYSMT